MGVLPKYREVPEKLLSPLSETLSQMLSGFVGNKTNFDKVSDEVSDKDPEERVLGQARDFPLARRAGWATRPDVGCYAKTYSPWVSKSVWKLWTSPKRWSYETRNSPAVFGGL